MYLPIQLFLISSIVVFITGLYVGHVLSKESAYQQMRGPDKDAMDDDNWWGV
jgi:hypothetical protein